MFCRSPITGARETLGHRNGNSYLFCIFVFFLYHFDKTSINRFLETAYKNRLEKLKRCVVFIGSLQKIIDSKDMNDVTTDVDLLKTLISFYA